MNLKFSKKIVILIAIVVVLLGSFFVLDLILKAREIASLPTVFERNLDDQKSSLTEDGLFQIDPSDSLLNWSAGKTLVPGYTDIGVVRVESGTVEIANQEIVSANFSINMSSIEALKTGSGVGMNGLTNHLKSADFFDVENFPTAEFELTSVRKYLNDFEYEVQGDLTIKGITNPVTFLAEIYSVNDQSVKAIARVLVDRTNYDIRFRSGRFFSDLGDNMIDDQFLIEFELVANKIN